MWVHLWDEISCEWEQIDLEIPLDAEPEAIVRAVDEKTAQPFGFLPEDEAWSPRSWSLAGPLLTIECRTSRGHLGIILVNYEENRLGEASRKEGVSAQPTTNDGCR